MIHAIYVAKKPKDPLQQVDEVQVVFGAGITGDRYFKKAKYPGQNVTFIELEAIEKYNEDFGQAIGMSATRRNIVTEGVDLNALVGKEFAIGTAKFRGVELCEPCSLLGRLLENSAMSRADVVRAFLTSGGLRADVIQTGIVSVGMPFDVVESKRS